MRKLLSASLSLLFVLALSLATLAEVTREDAVQAKEKALYAMNLAYHYRECAMDAAKVEYDNKDKSCLTPSEQTECASRVEDAESTADLTAKSKKNGAGIFICGEVYISGDVHRVLGDAAYQKQLWDKARGYYRFAEASYASASKCYHYAGQEHYSAKATYGEASSYVAQATALGDCDLRRSILLRRPGHCLRRFLGVFGSGRRMRMLEGD